MNYDEDSNIPLSQLANEAFNPVAPRGAQPPPTNFARQLPANGASAGHGPGRPAAPAAPKPPSRHGKLFQDSVHDAFRLDPISALIFDTRQFQRLRRLKQLGLTYMVFPTACHNRFEHSLGVAHLAYKFGSHLWNMQRGELEIERRDLQLVELAGLCHDLGHGPFSHVFDREFLRRKGITDWEHEEMSTALLDHIIDQNHIDALSPADVSRVKSMIMAGHGEVGAPPGQRWLWEIVANGRNGIDVDKAKLVPHSHKQFDYLARDSRMCGIQLACNFNRLMQFSKVIGDEICFKYTEYMNLYELFHARASMHRQVYTHKKCKAVEFMVVDALLEADPVLRISHKIRSPAEFQLLDDGLLDMVENFELFGRLLNLEPEDEAALRSAQAIVARLRRRDLYKYVSDALIPQEHLERNRWATPTAEDVVSCYGGTAVRLRPEDIILQENKIDFSAKSSNPLDKVHFFDSLEATEKRKLRPDQISSMVVACHQERSLRVYSCNSSPEYVQAVHEAFEGWTRRQFGSRVLTSTPSKPPRPPPRGPVPAAAEPGLGGGGDAAGAKRSRDLFPSGSSDDDASPSNLMKTKHMRQ